MEEPPFYLSAKLSNHQALLGFWFYKLAVKSSVQDQDPEEKLQSVHDVGNDTPDYHFPHKTTTAK